MSTFLKYLLSLAAHMAWMRAGKSGPVPPVRLPHNKKPLPLPVIGPWQMLIATWVLRKLWQRYGDDVRARVAKVDHPAAQKIYDLIPSGNSNSHAARATSQPPATFVIPGVPATAPAGPSGAGASAAQSANTQRLPRQTDPDTGSSLLSRLRKGA